MQTSFLIFIIAADKNEMMSIATPKMSIPNKYCSQRLIRDYFISRFLIDEIICDQHSLYPAFVQMSHKT